MNPLLHKVWSLVIWTNSGKCVFQMITLQKVFCFFVLTAIFSFLAQVEPILMYWLTIKLRPMSAIPRSTKSNKTFIHNFGFHHSHCEEKRIIHWLNQRKKVSIKPNTIQHLIHLFERNTYHLINR